jgi:hypothetical protein
MAVAPPPPTPPAAALPPLAVPRAEANALFDYAGDGSDWQLKSMVAGNTVEVHEQNDDGWWKVTVLSDGDQCGNNGMVPASYLKLR